MQNTITKNIAFFDAEFTARSEKDRGVQEMIQCAFIVHKITISEDNVLVSMEEQPLFVYKTFVKPMYNCMLSDYIKELTGIQQHEVDAGKSFVEVLDDIYTTAKEFNIETIFTWGPDKLLFRNNCNVMDCNQKKAKYIHSAFMDLSAKLSDYLGYDVIISQHKVCQLLGISEVGNRHDAFYDAINLSKVIRTLVGQVYL